MIATGRTVGQLSGSIYFFAGKCNFESAITEYQGFAGLMIEDLINFPEARTECTPCGAQIAAPRNDDELNALIDFMQNVMSNQPPVWIGIKYIKHLG